VELDYISNPERERLLKTASHQNRLATALLDASRTFLKKQGRLPTQVGSSKKLEGASPMRLSASSLEPSI